MQCTVCSAHLTVRDECCPTRRARRKVVGVTLKINQTRAAPPLHFDIFVHCQEMSLNGYFLLVSLCLLVCSHGFPAIQLNKKAHNAAVTGENLLEEENAIMVNLTGYVYEVSDQFLSVTIDAGNIKYNWEIINFTAPRVINMAKALVPAMLRVGGTAQDFVIFEESTELNQESNFTMNSTEWDAVNTFVEAVGWDFIFGLNVLLRKNGSWDDTDAEELMMYTTSKGYQVNWELGNGIVALAVLRSV